MSQEQDMKNVAACAVMAEFDHPADLMHACEKVRDKGFKDWDAYTPFPVHGLDDAMGVKQTVLPWVVLIAGLSGLFFGHWLQWYSNVDDYPFLISGKPLFSLPSNIPVIFECTVLFSAFAAFFGTIIMGGLPKWSHPFHRKPRFMRATSDRFFIAIDAKDPMFAQAQDFLGTLGADHVDVCEEDTSPDAFPPVVRWVGMIVPLLALIPFALIVKARYSTSTEPRFHLVPDMDFGPSYKGQSENKFFADGRAMRMPVGGTVARGELRDNEAYYTGKVGEEYVTEFPLEVTHQLMVRGRDMFDVSCAPCHGKDGMGEGFITARANEKEYPWVNPKDLTMSRFRGEAVGRLFESITKGRNNMEAFEDRISTKDRWSIILYLKALHRRDTGKLEDIPAEHRGN